MIATRKGASSHVRWTTPRTTSRECNAAGHTAALYFALVPLRVGALSCAAEGKVCWRSPRRLAGDLLTSPKKTMRQPWGLGVGCSASTLSRAIKGVKRDGPIKTKKTFHFFRRHFGPCHHGAHTTSTPLRSTSSTKSCQNASTFLIFRLTISRTRGRSSMV